MCPALARLAQFEKPVYGGFYYFTAVTIKASRQFLEVQMRG